MTNYIEKLISDIHQTCDSSNRQISTMIDHHSKSLKNPVNTTQNFFSTHKGAAENLKKLQKIQEVIDRALQKLAHISENDFGDNSLRV